MPKDLIEGRKIERIEVDRFSDAFVCNISYDVRPAGGDYFSTIRIFLDSGIALALCGDDAEADGYVMLWCENDQTGRQKLPFLPYKS